MQCSFEGCRNQARCKTGKYAGLCNSHRSQLHRNRPLTPIARVEPGLHECSFEGCDKPVLHKLGKYAGLCTGHKAQASRGVGLRTLADAADGLESRFLRSVEKTETCWLWTGTKTKTGGYGELSIKNATRRAHRVAYELWVGPLDETLVVHHTCSVRTCVNPAHLQAITQHENAAEMLERKAYLARIVELEAEVLALRSEKKGWFRRAK
jgi:hypothetical protein